MKNLTRGILLIVFALAIGLAPALQAQGDRFAAIAYSPKTGRWGYGTNYPSKSAAIARALRECHSSGAKTFWCKNAWGALALSNGAPGGYGWFWAETPEEARRGAIRECLAYNPDAHVVVCVSAYGE